ncbi:MAG TPA: hypothetical protein VFZ36_08965 [Vicinamibacterales bacterium]
MPSQVALLLLATAVMFASGLAWFSWGLTRLPLDAPERIVGELRLSQAGATVLAVSAASYAGLAAAAETTPGASADVALAGLFAGVALLAHLREPRASLALLAAGFAAHALVDIAHRPGLLPVIAPRWFAAGGATFDLILAAVCFAPLVRR